MERSRTVLLWNPSVLLLNCTTNFTTVESICSTVKLYYYWLLWNPSVLLWNCTTDCTTMESICTTVALYYWLYYRLNCTVMYWLNCTVCYILVDTVTLALALHSTVSSRTVLSQLMELYCYSWHALIMTLHGTVLLQLTCTNNDTTSQSSVTVQPEFHKGLYSSIIFALFKSCSHSIFSTRPIKYICTSTA
jgi:hypothetical protein